MSVRSETQIVSVRGDMLEEYDEKYKEKKKSTVPFPFPKRR